MKVKLLTLLTVFLVGVGVGGIPTFANETKQPNNPDTNSKVCMVKLNTKMGLVVCFVDCSKAKKIVEQKAN